MTEPTRLRFVQVDAFADRPFAGNPAAVMPLDAWLPDTTLQAIAAENNLAETAFLVRADGQAVDWELRWFTPTIEIELCGHATLASGHVLLGDDGGDRVRFATRWSGILEVRRDGDGYALDLPANPGTPRELPELIRLVGGEVQESWWNDRGYALLVYGSEAEVRALDPDLRGLRECGSMLTAATAPGEATDIVSRVFAGGAGIDEDPVTGGAHTMLAPFWAARLGRDRFTAFQASARGGRLECRLAGDRVVLGGRCVTVIEGQFLLEA